MAAIADLTPMIRAEVERLGFALVRVKMIGGKKDPTLQVMAERKDTRQLTIDDCATLSHALSDLLDREDPIDHGYRLEVSSPGIDRPLTRLKDFDDWAGHEVRINLVEPVMEKKQYRGTILSQVGEAITIDVPGEGEIVVDFQNIHSAKLVLTEKLIEETAPLEAEGADVTETEHAEEEE